MGKVYTEDDVQRGAEMKEAMKEEGIDPYILEQWVTSFVVHMAMMNTFGLEAPAENPIKKGYERFATYNPERKHQILNDLVDQVSGGLVYVDTAKINEYLLNKLILLDSGSPYSDPFDHPEVNDCKGNRLELNKYTKSPYKVYWYIVNVLGMMLPGGLTVPMSPLKDYLMCAIILFIAAHKYKTIDPYKIHRDISSYLSYLQDPQEYRLTKLLETPIMKPSQIDVEDVGPTLIEYDFTKHDTICISAACGMGKTVGLDRMLKSSKMRVLVITFRVCQVDKHMQDWGKWGFHNYSDIEGVIASKDYPRVVCQIDSLGRVKGSFDLIILDESEYTIAHLMDFVKNKYRVYEALKIYVEKTKNVIALDAQLSDLTLTLLKDCKRTPYVYFNTYPQHRQVSVQLVQQKNHFNHMLLDHLQKGLKVVLPTNSNTYAKTISSWISQRLPHLKVGLINSENIGEMKSQAGGDIVNIFAQYDFLVYTPVICAGNSFNELHFDLIMGYFTSKSSIAEMSCQQLYRVRQTTQNKIVLFISYSNQPPLQGITFEEIRQHYVNAYKIVGDNALKVASSLVNASHYISVDPVEVSIDAENTFFKLFCHCSLKINESKRNYQKRMIALLKRQGVNITGYVALDQAAREADYSKEMKEIMESNSKIDLQKIVDATYLDYDEYANAQANKSPSQEDKNNLLKTNYINDFRMKDKTQFTFEFIKKYRPYKLAFRIMTAIIVLRDEPRETYEKSLRERIFERFTPLLPWLSKAYVDMASEDKMIEAELSLHRDSLYESLTNRKHQSKLWNRILQLHYLLEAIGFTSFFHKDEVKIDANKGWDYAITHRFDIVFETPFVAKKSKKKTDTVNTTDTSKPKHNEQSYILRKFNSLLQTYLGLSIKRSRSKSSEYYSLKGLDLWDIHVDVKNNNNLFISPTGIIPLPPIEMIEI